MRMRRLILIATATLALAGSVIADDLYKVSISSADEARRLAATSTEALIRLDDGYLVLVSHDDQESIDESGLPFIVIARNIDRGRLAVDNRLDRANVSRFSLLHEQGNFRLYTLDQPLSFYRGVEPEVSAISTEPLEITFPQPGVSPAELLTQLSPNDVPLLTLISGVLQDSLTSYTNRLQAYYRRPAGTDSNYASRDWIAARFTAFGYDSVVVDSFTTTIGGLPTPCQNVLAYKIGTVYPNHQVIIGAHRDGVAASPGADDNGSGTAAVLEVARALKDVPTDVTMIFSLYDAEENGLLGSADYVQRAYTRDDSIVYMLNMDMIAQAGNFDSANIYHGAALQYSNLWLHLADSLAGITKGVLKGTSGGSDHYPFQQKGYEVSFVQEGIFSTVYHTYRDSTSFMNFEYMTRMVQASLATAYSVSQSFAPAATLVLDYAAGYPVLLTPGVGAGVEINIAAFYGASVAPGSVMLNYRIENGSWLQIPMAPGGIGYSATLPALGCLERVHYYVSAQDQTTSQTYYAPSASDPIKAWAASNKTTTFSDNCNTDLGWTVGGYCADGPWTLGVPVGLGDRGDPPTAFGGAGSCWLTDNVYGNSDVDNGNTTLMSPKFSADLTTRVEYAVWYSNDFGAAPLTDAFKVYISNNNGMSWTLANSIGPVYHASGGWYVYSLWVKDYLTPTSDMRLMFEADDLGSGSVIEAGLDNILIENFTCAPPPCCVGTTGNADGSLDDVVDISDAFAVVDYLGASIPLSDCASENDVNIDGTVDIGDLFAIIDYLSLTAGLPACP